MSKSQNKTIATKQDVSTFVEAIKDQAQISDTKELIRLMKKITGEKPVIWGDSIVGFGTYHYKYASGREGDFMKIGFAPRKNKFSIYIMAGFRRYEELLADLGNYKTGKSCLYIKNLGQIDKKVLSELIDQSYRYMTEKYG